MPTLDFSSRGDFADGSKGNERRTLLYTGPASYATGGDSLPPGAVKLGRIKVILFEPALNAAGTAILLLRYDYAASKVKWFDMAGAEVAAATDLSGYSAGFEVIGT